MEVKLFYKTQRELAIAINTVIDAYWKENIKEEELIKKINVLYKNNQNKMMKNQGYTTVIKQQCGKRRLEIVDRVIHMQQELQ
ncbi:TIGR04540 family protein [Salinicoccus roseus]|uniref:TIGR04540 family protein n=1 Tax=Salinicoccus roseus TaxID=45670 RepID=UPI0035237904